MTSEMQFDADGRLLVIEDQEPLLGQMCQLLTENFKKIESVVARIDVARFADFARSILLSAPHRVVSFDLGIAGSSKSAATSASNGGRVLSEAYLPLTKKVVFSGYVYTNKGLRSAMMAGDRRFVMLSKGAQTLVSQDDETQTIASPGAWADVMAYLYGVPEGNLHEHAFIRQLKSEMATQGLTAAMQPWFDAYWKRAQDYLPRPLAEAAFGFERARERNGMGSEAVLALNDFREWALTLARAQTAVVLRAGAGRAAMPLLCRDRMEALRAMEPWLSQAAGQINPATPGGLAWLNYLGSNGKRTQFRAIAAMDALHKFRNQDVHGTKGRREHNAAPLRDMLAPVMDMASFWADCPLLVNLRPEAGQWIADTVWGRSRGERSTLPDGTRVPPPSNSHAYQVLWQFDSEVVHEAPPPKPVLVDWWPWLRYELNPASGLREPLLLSHPVAELRSGARRWVALFLSGEATELTVAASDFD